MDDVDDVLAQLTLAEKAALCLGADVWHTAGVPRLGVPGVRLSDGPHGLRVLPSGSEAGISGSLPATCFPTASALGSSWDVDLIAEVGAAIGAEARALGVGVVLGPGVNLKRSPLCGRNFEYFSEDPHLAGRLGAALVEGIQSRGVGACVKHFAVNNQETDRLRVDAVVDERTLRELYLPAFEHIVTTARPWTVMCAYNRVNGVHASQHRWLLTEVLRGEWGFEGLVMSDWGAVHDRVAALAAGLDLEMPPHHGVSDVAVIEAVGAGTLPVEALDAAAHRVLALAGRAPARPAAAPDLVAHHALARRAAAESTVLLRNTGVLPLVPEQLAGARVCVVGEFARSPRFQGAGSSQVNATRVDSPLAELRRLLPGVEVEFAAGYSLDPEPGADRPLADAAVAAAASAQVVVAFLGLPAEAESEGFDRAHLELPPVQTVLLDRLLDGPAPVVVALTNGSAVSLAPWHERAAAVLECWLGGQAAGGGLADVLTGAVDPGGRLTETLPLRLQDVPSYLNFPGEAGQVRYGEGVFVGYRGFDALDREVAYPFGHGLSYTRFEYADLAVRVTGEHRRGDLTVEVELGVRNVGPVAGVEVVQLYVGAPQATVARPPRELRRFAKLRLEPGDSGRVRFELGARDLAHWSPRHRQWVVEGGRFTIDVGASSRDLRLHATLDVAAEPPPSPLDDWSTLEEWLADPVAGPALTRALTDADGRPRGILADPELLRVVANFPLHTLAAFPGLGITADLLGQLSGT